MQCSYSSSVTLRMLSSTSGTSWYLISNPRWLSWLEHHPIHQKAAGSTTDHSVHRRQPINVSPSFPLTLSLKSMNISSSEDYKVKLKNPHRMEASQIPTESPLSSHSTWGN